MANSLDLIINLVVQNQDATKKLAEQLNQLSQIKIPPLDVPIGAITGIDKLQQKIADQVRQLGQIKIPPIEVPIGDLAGVYKLQQKLLELQSQTNKIPPIEVPIGDLAGVYKLQQKFLELQSQTNKIPPIEVPIGDTSGIDKIQKEIDALAAKSTSIPPISIPVSADGFKEVIADTVRLADRLGISAEESKKLQQSLNLPTDKIEIALAKLQQFERVKLPIEEQFRSLNKELGDTDSRWSPDATPPLSSDGAKNYTSAASDQGLYRRTLRRRRNSSEPDDDRSVAACEHRRLMYGRR